MNKLEVMPVFAKAIGRTVIDIGNIDLSNIEWVENYGNKTSKDTSIFNLPEFEPIAEAVYQRVCEYFYGVMQASTDIEIFITESWLNKTEPGDFHHKHWHPNSIVSGVLYLQADGTTGQVKFVTPQYDMIEYATVTQNIFNARAFEVTPQVGELMLFPSNLDHSVDRYTGEQPRISLSFNTFIKGPIHTRSLMSLQI